MRALRGKEDGSGFLGPSSCTPAQHTGGSGRAKGHSRLTSASCFSSCTKRTGPHPGSLAFGFQPQHCH